MKIAWAFLTTVTLTTVTLTTVTLMPASLLSAAEVKLGKPLTPKQAMPLKTVQVRGKITAVCQMMGATRSAILFQFLLEANGHRDAGGLLRCLIGWAVTAGIQTTCRFRPLLS